MRRVSQPPALALALLISVTAGVGGAVALTGGGNAQPSAVRSTATPTAAPSSPTPTVRPPSPLPITVPSPRAPARRTYPTHWRAFATTGPVTLHYPVDEVELVGFHQSTNDGARQLRAIGGAGRFGRLDSRERDTASQGAADVVVAPGHAVRAPVTGRVIRAGSYTLYCHYRDNYVVIEPDARPGWEVKLLHFEGLAVGKGDRVRAGVTVIGAQARKLPFASQVDEHTAAPHWPHVHVEVVDPTIPDRPSKPCS